MNKPLKNYDDFPYLLDEEARKNLVEITDNNDIPFLLMPEHIVKKKKMRHRIIFVVLKDKKNRILFVKKHAQEENNSLWEFPCYGIVFAGESAEGTAYKELEDNFYIDDSIKMKEITTLPYLQDDIYVMATVFSAGPYYGTFRYNEEKIQDAMFVDKDELNGLLTFSPEIFNPIINWANRASWLY